MEFAGFFVLGGAPERNLTDGLAQAADAKGARIALAGGLCAIAQARRRKFPRPGRGGGRGGLAGEGVEIGPAAQFFHSAEKSVQVEVQDDASYGRLSYQF